MNTDVFGCLGAVLEFLDDQADVVDGPDGEQQANKAMWLAMELKGVIEFLAGRI